MELLFIDTETGGLDPESDSLLQIGLVAFKEGSVVAKEIICIKEEYYKISAEAINYNKLDIYNDVYKVGKEPKEALSAVIDFIKNNFNAKPIIAGHNVSMDKYFIRKLFSRHSINMDEYISYRLIDTMGLLWALHSVGKLPKKACSSTGAFNYFGIEVEKRHNALDDCIATAHLYEKLIQMIK